MNIGTELISRVISIAYGGEGIIKYEDLIGFVHGVLPDELIRFHITEIKKNYFRANLLEVIEPSPYRKVPKCPYFNICGGCVYQHLIYEKQLEIKVSQLKELLKHIGKIPEIKTPKTILSPKIFNYRNQITLKVKTIKDKILLGFIGLDNKTFAPIEKCLIARDPINNKIQEIKNELEKGIRIKKIEGEIIIKCSANGETDYAFLESISPKADYKLLYEKIHDKTCYFSLATFFQVNPYILPSLLSQLKSSLDPAPSDTIFDLYSGAGLFSIYLAPYVKNIYAIEINPNAVRLAKKTVEENKIRNCHFFSGKVEELLPKIYEQYKGNKNTIIVDPPRQGLSKDVLRYIASIPIDKLVYISCEPARLARDLFFLSQNGYKVNDIIVVDMFPQTKYLETLVFLVK